MGAYVNPRNQDKESWLEENGVILEMTEVNVKKLINEREFLPVCLVDNGMFTAAAIAFNENELSAFLYPDGRPKTWYLVKVQELLKVSDLKYYLVD